VRRPRIPDSKRIEVIDDQMAAIYRSKSSAEKLAIAHGIWRYTRERLGMAIRNQFPQWDDKAVNQEVSRRMLSGSDEPVRISD
jgi:hypothetical protein